MANCADRDAPRVTRCAGSEAENIQNSKAVTRSATAYTCGTMTQAPPAAALSAGATNLVMAAPELPAPNTPIARPCLLRGNQRATYGVPTENEPPVRPTNSASTRNCQYSVA
ncbi:hypothetical protein G6F40_016757 [Rhizopus arrhizus]|nr:hypothetical protein G6F40_016757 [Rhizopus arrhizus]